MLIYGAICLLLAIVLIGVGLSIFRGNTGLIHEYHQKRVTDKVNYGKAMGKAIGGMGNITLLSGLVSFVPGISVFIPIAILTFGYILCLTAIVRVQIKYNSGMF